MLIQAMEQELYYGTKDNMEIVDITDEHLELTIRTMKTVRVDTVLFLDRVGEKDKLDREWVVDNFMPLLSLYAHREGGTQPLGCATSNACKSGLFICLFVCLFVVV